MMWRQAMQWAKALFQSREYAMLMAQLKDIQEAAEDVTRVQQEKASKSRCADEQYKQH